MIENIIPSTFRSLDRVSYPFFVKIVDRYFSKMTKGNLLIKDVNRDVYLEFGNEPGIEAVIHVNDPDFFRRLVFGGDIGLAETYMEGLWDTPSIDNVISWFIQNQKNSPSMSGSEVSVAKIVNVQEIGNRLGHALRKNTVEGSEKNIHDHYDLGNDFFSLFLDPTMTYSSGVFLSDEDTLEQSQYNKFAALAKAGRMTDGLDVLEVGTGWGAFSCYLAQNYDCKVTTITISKEQFAHAKEKVSKLGLEDRITVLLKDYRELTGSFDRVFTVEMLEAVGGEFLQVFFERANQWLRPSGVMAHQVILCADTRYEKLKNGIDFIQKHIFPGSLLPSLKVIMEEANKHDDYFLIECQDYSRDYGKTLKLWQQAFLDQKEAVKELGFDGTFIRKWDYYFSYCAAAFFMRNITVSHMAMTRVNNHNLKL